jgi:hypothetical protein
MKSDDMASFLTLKAIEMADENLVHSHFFSFFHNFSEVSHHLLGPSKKE